ncbi:nucleolar and coiled-body phosphoprotein 1-like, partial [Triticum dicoccoides]|uniref:nucleolar and coiled-body phosphoprotein 1-like n=1 Tax=Triticum dicoccoides TaxID=85692 RepID=UPI0018901678
SSLGAEYSDDHRPAVAVKPFLAAPDADALATANKGLAFVAAVAHARATAVAILCDALTCPCARGPNSPPPPPPPPADESSTVVITGVANLEPREFLAALGSAAVDAPAVSLIDRARLESWVRALAQGWGPDGPGRYQRRTKDDLIDKIDLDMLADDGAASEEEEKKAVVPHKAPKQRKRRTKAPTPKDKEEEEEEEEEMAHKTPKQRRRAKASLLDSEEEEEQKLSSQNKDESGTALSGRRERKKSKYLSPPYTNIGVFALEDKSPDDSPKKSPPARAANKDERKNNKASPEEKQQHKKKTKVVPPPLPLDNVNAQEVLLLLRCFGEDVSHKRHFPKAAEDFLGLLRSSVFAEGAHHDSYKDHECPVAKNAVEKAAAAADVLVSDSAATPKQGKGKRGRKKKDQDGSGDSSVKTKKAEKTSPTDCAAEDASEENKKEENVSEKKKRGRKKKEQDGTSPKGSVINKRKKMDKTSPKATLGPASGSGSGLVITPAIPIRQVSAEDIMGQVKPGAGVPDPMMKSSLLVSKSPISAIMSGGVKSGEEQDQGDTGSVVNASSDQSAKNNEEATKPETGMNVDTLDAVGSGAQTQVTTPMNVDMNVDTLGGDVALAEVTMPEATKPETGGIQVDMNVECIGVVDVPVTSVQMEAMELEASIPVVDINEQIAAVEDVPATSGWLPPMHGDVISQPAHGNKDNASVQGRAVQESYTSLIKAMVPDMYKKVEEVAAGTGAAPQGDEAQKVQETSQMKAVADGASHSSPAKGTTNGSPCPDAPNSAQKRRNKKPAAAYFANPAELRVKFLDGTMVPTKEELLSEFRRFGVLVESECDISEERRDARVVFGKSTEAEAAYTKAEIPGIFGQFGPPWATLGLNYLEAITLAPARPAKPPLARADMRKNVENMISSLKNGGRSLPLNVGAAAPAGGAAPVSAGLLAEMQRLLSKLDKTQPAPGPSGSAPPPSS